MTKSGLIEDLAGKRKDMMKADVEFSVKIILDRIAIALMRNERVEIRGFGSFVLHHRKARIGRNPKSGATVHVLANRVPHFRAGKEMRQRVSSGSETSSRGDA